MNKRIMTVAIVMAFVLSASVAQAAVGSGVVTYHNSLDRHGDYVVPGLTISAAAGMQLDTRFNGKVSGHVYAQPLYWFPTGAKKGEVIVATESNSVYALDADSGKVVWKSQLAGSVRLSELQCGNIDPIGITGTPVIDPDAGIVYLDALTNQKSGPTHMLYALSLANGSVVSGWPLNVNKALAAQGFSGKTQGERSALLLWGGYLYVNYAGNWGDCGTYNGTVIQVQTAKPSVVANWATRANGGGIWAQGGLAGDGKFLFLTTGNTFGASSWMDGEAIIKLKPGLRHSTNTQDYFAPSNWQDLDNSDLDLGGTEALPIDIAVSGAAPARRVIALGKDGNAYLVDRANLGGIGGQLAVTQVSTGQIRTAAAVYQTRSGTMVAFSSPGSSQCGGGNLTMLGIAASGNALITPLWCASFNGGGDPMITTTDGTSNAIVWVLGAEGDNLLHGYNVTTGAVVFGGGNQVMSGLRHFETLIAANHHLYVGADNRIYAFTF